MQHFFNRDQQGCHKGQHIFYYMYMYDERNPRLLSQENKKKINKEKTELPSCSFSRLQIASTWQLEIVVTALINTLSGASLSLH